MKLRIVLALALAAALAACGPKSEASKDAKAVETGSSYPQPDLPLADGAACVIDVAADAVCTTDLNPCGHASQCACPSGYGYNGSLGKCVLKLDGVSSATKVDVADDKCVSSDSHECTRDINVCGNASLCKCEDGFGWNEAVGKCVSGLGLG